MGSLGSSSGGCRHRRYQSHLQDRLASSREIKFSKNRWLTGSDVTRGKSLALASVDATGQRSCAWLEPLVGVRQVRSNAGFTTQGSKPEISSLEITLLLAVCRAVENCKELASKAVGHVGNILKTIGERANAEAVVAALWSAATLGKLWMWGFTM